MQGERGEPSKKSLFREGGVSNVADKAGACPSPRVWHKIKYVFHPNCRAYGKALTDTHRLQEISHPYSHTPEMTILVCFLYIVSKVSKAQPSGFPDCIVSRVLLERGSDIKARSLK